MSRTRETPSSAQRIMQLLPGLFQACLLACLLTGAMLLFHYRPMGEVSRGVEAITTLAPYGFFFRRVHFAAGQACALLALLHLLRHLVSRRRIHFSIARWLRLSTAVAVCFALLTTGFILKGDVEAHLAGTVLRGLAESVPVAGTDLGGLVTGEGETFFLPPYVLHCFVLPVALLGLLGRHVRRWLPDRTALVVAGLGLGIWGVSVPMPLSPPSLPALEASGPWFLYGLQEALRHAPPLVAGVILPVLLLAALSLLPTLRGRLGRILRMSFTCAIGAYLALGLALA